MRLAVGNSAELLPRTKTVKYAATVGPAFAYGRTSPDVGGSALRASRSFRLFRGHARKAVVPIRFF
jgi:hypothetical protein